VSLLKKISATMESFIRSVSMTGVHAARKTIFYQFIWEKKWARLAREHSENYKS